jgi:mRNA interferase RelE/StbE
VTDSPTRHTLIITPTARCQLVQHLPEAVAIAAHEVVVGALLDNPQGVGKRLQAPLGGRHSAQRGTYRVIYRIGDADRTVTVIDIAHRRDAYRANR